MRTLWVALLALLLLQHAAAVRYQSWWEMSESNTRTGVLVATGYSCEVLDYIWQIYSTQLANRLAALERPVSMHEDLLAGYFFAALVYIHHYPRWNKFVSQVISNRRVGKLSETKLYTIVYPVIACLSQVVDEVHWDDRFDNMNHGSHFMRDRFTTIFDGSNINISNINRTSENPLRRLMCRLLFNGSKYNHCCYKFMIGITFTGVIVHFTGLHLGTLNDNVILDEYPPDFRDWEWGLGDGAFENSQHILIKYQQPDGGVLTRDEVYFNSIFNYWRLRVEHIIGEVKNHSIFDHVFRGSVGLLEAALKLTIHMTNVKLKMALPRYETCGPWPHAPGSAPPA